MVERSERNLLEQDVALDEPGEVGSELVGDEFAGGDGEDPVEFLESTLHGLGDEEEDQDERNNVETGVHTEDTDSVSLGEQEGESDTQEGSETKAGSDGETHTDLTMRQGEDLGGVGERNRTFSRGVEGGEQEDEQADETTLGEGVFDESAETSDEQSPEHVGEGEQQERSAAESVNGPESGEGEDPVDETETERAKHSLLLGHTSVQEDGGGVEGNNVDTAELLSKHDSEGGERGTADTRDGEELANTGEVVGLSDDLVLDLELGANVEDITGNLNLVVTETQEGVPSFGVAVLLHQPTRRLGAEEDTDEQRDGGNDGSTQHETPVERLVNIQDSQVENRAQHDTESGPHLPGHDESTTDGSGSVLSSVDGDSRGLETHTNTHEKTASELLAPGLTEGRTEDRPDTEVGSEEDSPATTEVEVEGISEPRTAESSTNVGTGVDETDDNLRASFGLRVNSVVGREEDGGTVGTGLIPTLDSSTNGAGGDGHEQTPGHAPLVVDFVLENLDLEGSELLLTVDVVDGGGVLGDEGTLPEHGKVLLEALGFGEDFDIGHELFPGETLERVADLGLEVLGQVNMLRDGHATLFEVSIARHGSLLVTERENMLVSCWIN